MADSSPASKPAATSPSVIQSVNSQGQPRKKRYSGHIRSKASTRSSRRGSRPNHEDIEYIINDETATIELLHKFMPFSRWYDRLMAEIEYCCRSPKQYKTWFKRLVSIEVHCITRFVKDKPDNYNLMYVTATLEQFDGTITRQIIFLRGNSVAVLIQITEIENPNNVYMATAEQPRVPAAMRNSREVCAGMMDDSTNIVGRGIAEVQEELGITIDLKIDNVIILNKDLYGAHHNGIFPSIGGCDERLQFVLIEKEMSKERIDELRGREGGNMTENEHIVANVIPRDEFLAYCQTDGKAFIAYLLYMLYLVQRKGYTPQVAFSALFGNIGTPAYNDVSADTADPDEAARIAIASSRPPLV